MAAMSRAERRWVGGAAALAVLVAVVGWFFLISPQRSETADVQGQTADAQTQNLTLQSRIDRLGSDSKNRSKYAAALAAARQALPTRSDMSTFIRDVQAVAGRSSTRVTTLNVGDPIAVTPAGAATGAGGAAPASGMFAIPVDVAAVGQPAALSNFLTRLQSAQPRAVLVTAVSRTGSGSGAVLTLKLQVFVAPSAAAAPGSLPSGSKSGP